MSPAKANLLVIGTCEQSLVDHVPDLWRQVEEREVLLWDWNQDNSLMPLEHTVCDCRLKDWSAIPHVRYDRMNGYPPSRARIASTIPSSEQGHSGFFQHRTELCQRKQIRGQMETYLSIVCAMSERRLRFDGAEDTR